MNKRCQNQYKSYREGQAHKDKYQWSAFGKIPFAVFAVLYAKSRCQDASHYL